MRKFTCKQARDGWWDVFDRDGRFWTILKWEEEARKYCAEYNRDPTGFRYWHARLVEKQKLWSMVCEIEAERRK